MLYFIYLAVALTITCDAARIKTNVGNGRSFNPSFFSDNFQNQRINGNNGNGDGVYPYYIAPYHPFFNPRPVNCDETSCLNNGTCDGYNCQCLPEFTGKHCENINYCYPNPCYSYQVCSNTQDSYYCACSPGYTGPRCSQLIDFCASTPCRNNGKCTNVVLFRPSYVCECPTNYYGTNCEFYNYCRGQREPCLNGGTCVNYNSTYYYCDCARGFNGNRCQFNVTANN